MKPTQQELHVWKVHQDTKIRFLDNIYNLVHTTIKNPKRTEATLIFPGIQFLQKPKQKPTRSSIYTEKLNHHHSIIIHANAIHTTKLHLGPDYQMQ